MGAYFYTTAIYAQTPHPPQHSDPLRPFKAPAIQILNATSNPTPAAADITPKQDDKAFFRALKDINIKALSVQLAIKSSRDADVRKKLPELVEKIKVFIEHTCFQQPEMTLRLFNVWASTFYEGELSENKQITSYTKGHVELSTSIYFFHKYLEALPDSPETTAFRALISGLLDLSLLNKAFLAHFQENTEEQSIDYVKSIYLEKIRELKEGEALLLPGGWTNVDQQPGHLMLNLIRRDGDTFHIERMNTHTHEKTNYEKSFNVPGQLGEDEIEAFVSHILSFAFPNTLKSKLEGLPEDTDIETLVMDTPMSEVSGKQKCMKPQFEAANCNSVSLFELYEFLYPDAEFSKKDLQKGFQDFLVNKINALSYQFKITLHLPPFSTKQFSIPPIPSRIIFHNRGF